MTKETENKISLKDVVISTVLLLILAMLLGFPTGIIIKAGNEPPVEEFDTSSSYSEDTVFLTYLDVEYEKELMQPDRVMKSNLDLFINGYSVDAVYWLEEAEREACCFESGVTISYTHGNEWEGEDVRLVYKHNTPDEVVIYEGTAPDRSE